MKHNELKSALHKKIDTMPEESLTILHDFFSDIEPVVNASRNHKDIEEIVTDYIRSFGFLPHLKGYHYLRTALIIMIKNPKEFDDKITKLYACVAKRHLGDYATASRVERGIRHSLEVAYDKNPEQFEVFMKNGLPPTNSEFLYFAVDELTK